MDTTITQIFSDHVFEQVSSGKIRINTREDFELPKTQSLPLETRGKNCFYKFKIWLIDCQDEVLLEDYYFMMDWLPGKPIIKIPKGFIFNGASVPKPLRIFLSPKGILYASSIFHDFGYQYECWITIDNTLYSEANTRKFFDDQFRKYNDKVFDMDTVAIVSWTALRLFGFIAWNRCRADNRDVRQTFLNV